MASVIEPEAPQRGIGTKRQQELLKSARTQLGAILEGQERPQPQSELYRAVIALQAQIEQLLGY